MAGGRRFALRQSACNARSPTILRGPQDSCSNGMNVRVWLCLQSHIIHTGLWPGVRRQHQQETVSTVLHPSVAETVKTVSQHCQCLPTGLKPGGNEKDF